LPKKIRETEGGEGGQLKGEVKEGRGFSTLSRLSYCILILLVLALSTT